MRATLGIQGHSTQTTLIAIGKHAPVDDGNPALAGLTHPDCLGAQVHVIRGGPDAGKVELDILEIETRRIVMGELEAEALAHVFERMQGIDGKRLASALRVAAHLAREATGIKSTITHTDGLS